MKKMIDEIMHGKDLFSVREILLESWVTTKQYWGKATLLVIAYLLFVILFVVVSGLAATRSLALAVSLYLLLMFGYAYFLLLAGRMILWGAQRKEFRFVQLFIVRPMTLVSIITYSILYAIIVMCGFIALVFPGYYYFLLYSQGGFLILDKGMGTSEALAASRKIVQPYIFNVFSYWSISYALLYLVILPFYFLFLIGAAISGMLAVWIDPTVTLGITTLLGGILLLFVMVIYIGLCLVIGFGSGHVYTRLVHARS